MKAIKEARGQLASKTAHKPIVRAYYATLVMLANTFGAPFWFFEQRRGQLADWLDNEGSTR